MKALNKDILREIKNTSSRFISILILVALAVAFFSGLRATAPDMKGTLDKYMDEHEFMDIQVFPRSDSQMKTYRPSRSSPALPSSSLRTRRTCSLRALRATSW